MASNHGNLQKHCHLPWFKGHYGVHAEVNGKREKRGEQGRERRRERREWAGGDRTKKGMATKGGGRKWGGQGDSGKNRRTLVGHVHSYRISYKWEGAD